MTTVDEARATMMQRAGRHPTALLCGALEQLDRKRGLDEAERLTRSVLIDVLCERHPEADAAFDAWAASDDNDIRHAAPVITAAARAAASQGATA